MKQGEIWQIDLDPDACSIIAIHNKVFIRHSAKLL
jgi:hypothetical protein